MLAEANVTVVTQLVGLASAVKDGLALKSVTTESGDTLTGSVWVDGTYEGDLGYIAGAAMVWGRESVAQYNDFDMILDPSFWDHAGHVDPTHHPSTVPFARRVTSSVHPL